MKTITELMDALKEKYGSDYKTSKELGIDRSAISLIRSRNLVSDETAIKIAKALNMDECETLIIASMARSKGITKIAWEKVSQRAGFLSAIFVTNQCVMQVIDFINVYYVKSLRRIKKRGCNLKRERFAVVCDCYSRSATL